MKFSNRQDVTHSKPAKVLSKSRFPGFQCLGSNVQPRRYFSDRIFLRYAVGTTTKGNHCNRAELKRQQCVVAFSASANWEKHWPHLAVLQRLDCLQRLRTKPIRPSAGVRTQEI